MEETQADVYIGACAVEGCEPNVHVSELLATSKGFLLELSANEQALGRKGGAALAAMLRGDTGLTVLKLEGCDLYDGGVSAVCEALFRHPTVFRLDLGYNGLRALKPVARLLARRVSARCAL
ncbi:hypothetical protein T492DRAFT_866962 [Pavlovales sp. CCMP2436]|nr:hypothetical protein T492DRAFT_866962 [Pavlovales sp. CCMP2436]